VCVCAQGYRVRGREELITGELGAKAVEFHELLHQVCLCVCVCVTYYIHSVYCVCVTYYILTYIRVYIYTYIHKRERERERDREREGGREGGRRRGGGERERVCLGDRNENVILALFCLFVLRLLLFTFGSLKHSQKL
jgi:hypothetical protein